MAYGIKISKAGVDVKTASNKDLVLTSERSLFKVKQFSTVSYTFNGSEGSGTTVLATISHGLGYIPAVTVFVQDHTGAFSHLSLVFAFSGGSFREYISYEVSTSNLIIYYQSEGGAPSNWSSRQITFKYYIMYDEGM